MTLIELKGLAQEMLLHYGQVAFNKIEDLEDLTQKDKENLFAQMDSQLKRVEKLFGYEQGSWGRGV